MPRRPTASPDRILSAAALEFAERGYAGARVDRIARRARVNKAMLYYHFGSKQALYRALLRQIFSRAAGRLQAIATSEAAPDRKIERVIGEMAAFMAEHAFFPAIMLREIAEGGSHLDRDTLEALAGVPLAVGAIVQQGVVQKTLRSVHPIAAYFTMFAPILMYLAGAPIRKELTARRLVDMSSLPQDLFVQQLQQSVRLAFAVPRTRQSTRHTRHHPHQTSHLAP
jgi:TetR/AcrR family transcriptional regulator